jgi:hypothetical protein
MLMVNKLSTTKLAVCPNGATFSAWTPKKEAWNNAVIGVKFSNIVH